MCRYESQVCYHSATQSSQFDVSFPEKLLKFVATRGKIFSLKFTKYRLDGPPSRNKGGLLLRGGKGEEGKGGGEGEGTGGGKRGRARPIRDATELDLYTCIRKRRVLLDDTI